MCKNTLRCTFVDSYNYKATAEIGTYVGEGEAFKALQDIIEQIKDKRPIIQLGDVGTGTSARCWSGHYPPFLRRTPHAEILDKNDQLKLEAYRSLDNWARDGINGTVVIARWSIFVPLATLVFVWQPVVPNASLRIGALIIAPRHHGSIDFYVHKK